jgi:hypothetical protein
MHLFMSTCIPICAKHARIDMTTFIVIVIYFSPKSLETYRECSSIRIKSNMNAMNKVSGTGCPDRRILWKKAIFQSQRGYNSSIISIEQTYAINLIHPGIQVFIVLTCNVECFIGRSYLETIWLEIGSVNIDNLLQKDQSQTLADLLI